jgi:hypothetical protein
MAAAALSALAAERAEPMLQSGIIAVWVVAYLLLLTASGRFLRQPGGGPRDPPERSDG